MDDESCKEDKPSTSKKDDQGRDSRKEKERDDRSYTLSSASVVSSNRSRLLLRADIRPDVTKIPPSGKKGKPDRRKRVRRGRVSKRRKTKRRHRQANVRRHTYARRAPRRQSAERKDHDHYSVTTLFSRLSSPSGTNSACQYCGHICCGRRSIEAKRRREEAKRRRRRMLVRKITKELKQMRQRTCRNKGCIKRKSAKQRDVRKQLQKKRATDKKKDKRHKNNLPVTHRKEVNSANQVGSTCKMLSPLFVKTNATLEAGPIVQIQDNYKEITPEMIFYTLQRLQKWREYLNLELILSDLKKCYPVNRNTGELTAELVEKLRVAVIAGILMQQTIKDEEYWCLASDITKRGLTRNHVSLFWEAYGDSMSPVRRKEIKQPYANTVEDENECKIFSEEIL